MKKISTIKERLKQYLDYHDISQTEFQRITKVDRSQLSGNNLKSEFGGDKLVDILTIFKDLNCEWLMLGLGEMLRNEEKDRSTGIYQEDVRKSRLKQWVTIKMDEGMDMSQIAKRLRVSVDQLNKYIEGVDPMPSDLMARISQKPNSEPLPAPESEVQLLKKNLDDLRNHIDDLKSSQQDLRDYAKTLKDMNELLKS